MTGLLARLEFSRLVITLYPGTERAVLLAPKELNQMDLYIKLKDQNNYV